MNEQLAMHLDVYMLALAQFSPGDNPDPNRFTKI